MHSLASYNTFGIDVALAEIYSLKSEDQIAELIEQAAGRPIYIIGGGSNIIVPNSIDGLVVLNQTQGIQVERVLDQEVIISAAAGVNWHELVLWSIKQGFGGLENMALIPGTVGAAPIQNIGAYGVELKDVFEYLEAYNLQTGEKQIFQHRDCLFGYRDSIFKKKDIARKFYLSKVFLRLTTRNHTLNTSYGAIQQTLSEWNITQIRPADIAAAVIKIRRSKLPNWQELGNAGSFFKNPIVDQDTLSRLKTQYPNMPSYPFGENNYKLAAGWLIDQCGWKGKRSGNVGCYEKQALVLVNYGGAQATDILAFAQQIIDSVQSKFGVLLEREVRVLGE